MRFLHRQSDRYSSTKVAQTPTSFTQNFFKYIFSIKKHFFGGKKDWCLSVASLNFSHIKREGGGQVSTINKTSHGPLNKA